MQVPTRTWRPLWRWESTYGVRHPFHTQSIPRLRTPMPHRENHPPTPDAADGPQTPVRTSCKQTTSDAVILTIVASVSELVGTEPSELPPLNNTIDVDALSEIFNWDSAESSQLQSRCVTFRYEACEITVYADGQIRISPPER